MKGRNKGFFIYLLIIFLHTSNAFAQNFIANNNFIFNTACRDCMQGSSMIEYQGSVMLNSNSVRNGFVNNYLFESRLSQNARKRSYQNAQMQNRLGIDYVHHVQYNTVIDTCLGMRDLFFTAGLKTRDFASAAFNNDAWGLFLLGNKPFAGQKMNFSNTSLSYLNYQEVFTGFGKYLSDNFFMGIVLGFIKGGDAQYLDIDRGTLYTQEDGEYIDLSLKMKLQQYNDNPLPHTAFKGYGSNISVTGSYFFSKDKFLNLNIKDAGFISWKNMRSTEVDSNYHFEGFEIDDVFNFNDSTLKKAAREDLATNLNAEQKNKNEIKMLPLSIHLNYFHKIDRYQTILIPGAKYMLNAAYIPKFYLKAAIFPCKGFMITPKLAYGGFGRLNYGLGLSKSFRKSWMLSLQSNYLAGFVNPDKTRGQGLQLVLSTRF